MKPASAPPQPVRRRLFFLGVGLAGYALIACGWWLARRANEAAGTRPAPVIAVLPFTAVSSGDGPLAGQATAGVAAALAKVPGLNVAPPGSRLKPDGVLQGGVRNTGGGRELAAEFRDASSGNRIWTKTYKLNSTSAAAVSDEIARDLVTALRGRRR